MSEQYLTVEQAAERLQVHAVTVRRLMASGGLPGNRIGRQWRINASALEAYLAGRKPAASAGAAPDPQKTGTAGD
jgi:excisionase family DNA binding protein